MSKTFTFAGLKIALLSWLFGMLGLGVSFVGHSKVGYTICAVAVAAGAIGILCHFIEFLKRDTRPNP